MIYAEPNPRSAMRLVIHILVALLLAISTAGAYPETDPADDTATNPGGLPLTGFAHVDVLEMNLEDLGPEYLGISVKFAGAVDSSPAARYFVHMQRGSVAYLVSSAGNGTCQGWSLYLAIATRYQCLSSIEVAVEGNEIFAKVPRNSLLDERGIWLRAGDVVDNIVVQAGDERRVVTVAGDAIGGVIDRAPDTGTYGQFAMISGDKNKGDLSLMAETPIRLSNGQAATYVYDLTLKNLGDENIAASLVIENLDPAWNATAPAHVSVPAGASVRLPVIVSVPFRHEHGVTQTFDVALASSDGEDAASLTLGVHWLRVPLVSGHHPTMFLHSRAVNEAAQARIDSQESEAWMNTLPWGDDDAASDEPIAIAASEIAADHTLWRARIPLSPQLGPGLDFVAGENAVTEIKIGSGVDQDAVATFALFVETGSNQTLVFQSPSMPVQLTSTAASVDWAGPIANGLDVIRPPEGSMLVLEVMLRTATYSPEIPLTNEVEAAPFIEVSSSTVTLPLVDYQDPLDDAFLNVGGIALTSSQRERQANPGDTVTWNLHLVNHLASERRATVSLSGSAPPWLMFSTKNVNLASEGQLDFRVGANVPLDAAPGEKFSWAVVVTDNDDPLLGAIIVLRLVIVDESVVDIPSEVFATAEPGKKTPAGALWMALVIACAVAQKRDAKQKG